LAEFLQHRPPIYRPIDWPNFTTSTAVFCAPKIVGDGIHFGVRSPFLLNFLAKIFSFYFVPTYLLQAYFWG
jgi:hypothetical protein